MAQKDSDVFDGTEFANDPSQAMRKLSVVDEYNVEHVEWRNPSVQSNSQKVHDIASFV